VAADEDEKRQDKRINAGMIRLGLRAKPDAQQQGTTQLRPR
jgi:hypothetical protein